MLKPMAFANAFAAVGAAAYVVCWLLSAFAPDLIFTFSRAWAHTINLEAVRTTASMDFGTVLFGLVSWTVFVWVVTYAGAALYNNWARK